MVYDPVSHRVILYQMPQQLWSWDGRDWTELRPAHNPTAMGGLLTFDGTRVILVGAQVWGWTGTDWTSLSRQVPPLAPIEPIVFHNSSNSVLLYGGGPGDDTWTWSGSRWTREHPAHSPVSAQPPRMVDDRALNEVIAFAGDFQGPITGVYAWNGSDWTAVGDGSPPAAPAGRLLMSASDAVAKIRHTVVNTAPVLLPRFPAGVDQVMVTVDAGSLSIKAWNDDRSIEIDLATVIPGNSNLGAVSGTIPFRGTSGDYQYIAGDPKGWRSIWWMERPGHWAGDQATPPSNAVPYVLSTTGLTESEFFALGNSLR
jgi:hypothetical protein